MNLACVCSSGVAAIAFLAVGAPPALAEVLTFSTPLLARSSTTTVTGDTSLNPTPTFVRPNYGVPPTTQSTTSTRYNAHTFQTGSAGWYSVNSTRASAFTTPAFFVYQGAFNPASPMTNLIYGGRFPIFDVQLAADTSYTVVTSGHSGSGSTNSRGSYSNVIRTASSPQHRLTPAVFNPTTNRNDYFPVTIDLTIPDERPVGRLLGVELKDLNYTSSGLLTVTLTHVASGVTVDVIDISPSTAAGNRVGTDMYGDYEFVEGTGTPMPTFGQFNSGLRVLPQGQYNTFPNTSAQGLSTANGTYSAFDGLPMGGLWRLTVISGESNEIGAVAAFGLRFDTIPAPSALAPLGLACVWARRRRR